MAAADDATYSTSPLSPHCMNMHCDQCGWFGYGLVQLVFIVAHQRCLCCGQMKLFHLCDNTL